MANSFTWENWTPCFQIVDRSVPHDLEAPGRLMRRYTEDDRWEYRQVTDEDMFHRERGSSVVMAHFLALVVFVVVAVIYCAAAW
jgi:hypothetical protein